MKLKLKLNLRSHGSSLNFSLENLKAREVADLSETTITGTITALKLLEEHIDNLTEYIHGALVDTASEVFGKARSPGWPTTFQIYMTEEGASGKEGPLSMQNYNQVNQVIRRQEAHHQVGLGETRAA